MGGKKVCIVGSGNWGSAIAKIVGSNAARLDMFDPTVKMWVFEEEIAGQKLTEIINTQHENVKYLPGHKLPPNVVAVPDVLKASADADILIFVVPHQFIGKLCEQMKGRIKKEAISISLIKGVDEGPDGLKLISDIIREQLSIEMSVLMGANIANEVAEEKFCETTIGNGLEVMIHMETGDKLEISSPDMCFKCYATLRPSLWILALGHSCNKSRSTQTYYWLLLGNEDGHIAAHTLNMYF